MNKIYRIALMSLLLLLLASSLMGAYLTFQPVNVSQPDGTKLSLFATGDEYYNWLHDKDGYTIKQNPQGWYVYMELKGSVLDFTPLIAGRDNPAQRNIAPWTNISAEEMGQKRLTRQRQIQDIGGDRVPHSGTLNNLVIFIRFSDQTEFTDNLSYYNGMFNGAGNTMQAYFAEASYNALNISTSFYPPATTTVVSWQSSNIRGYYSPHNATTNPSGYVDDNARTSREHALLVSAVNGVSAQIPTSLNLDGDNDGKVDNVCFVIKGATDAWAELLWPHRWSLYSQYVYINSKRVYDYNFQLSEHLSSSGNGVLCHEMFHSLGAPDLYHYTSNGISPVGSWDLMCSNTNPPQHMSAYMKWKYVGWISSIPVASGTGTYTLNPLTSSTNNCYRINSPNSTTEYYMVEYRKKTGQFENSLPNGGLVFYRINTSAGNGNASGPPDEVYAYRPNGTSTINGDVSNAHFSEEAGRIMFNAYTNPNPFLESGSAGGISVQSISSSAGTTMNFTLASGDPLAQLNEGFESGVPSSWTNAGNVYWVTETALYYSGIRSLKSGTITHNQTSSILTNSLAMSAGQVSFFYKVSSEANYDYLKFYIDGVLKAQWSGEASWSMVAFNVTAGNHILKWEYMKDGSVNTGSDCAWIDHLAYPAVTFNPPQNLIATAGHTMVALSWQAPSTGTPTGYRIYRNSVLLTSTTGLSYNNTNLTNGTGYTYYIKAVYTNPTGESVASNSVNATPVALPPVSLTGIAGNATVTLNWTAPAVGSPTGYIVYRNATYLTTVTALNYTDNSVVNTLSYTYNVTAQYANPVTESAASNTIAMTPVELTQITVASGTTTNQGVPMEPYYGYTYSQSIYLQSELNQTNKQIAKLSWQYAGGNAFTDAIKIYMGHTNQTVFSGTGSWVPFANLTLVYDGTITTTTTSSWIELTLATPFTYNNTQNLVIAVDENTTGYHANADEFYCMTVTGTRSIVYYNDTTNPNPASPPTSGSYLYTRSTVPNLKLSLVTLPLPVFSYSAGSMSFGAIAVGTSATTNLTIHNNGATSMTGIITTPAGFTVSTSRESDLRNSLSYDIPYGESRNYVVTFSPVAVQNYSGNLTITSTDPLHSMTAIAMSGSGMASVPGPVISQTGSVLRLDWNAIPGATQYKVYRSLSPTTGFTLLSTVSINYLLLSSTNHHYFYTVTAVFP